MKFNFSILALVVAASVINAAPPTFFERVVSPIKSAATRVKTGLGFRENVMASGAKPGDVTFGAGSTFHQGRYIKSEPIDGKANLVHIDKSGRAFKIGEQHSDTFVPFKKPLALTEQKTKEMLGGQLPEGVTAITKPKGFLRRNAGTIAMTAAGVAGLLAMNMKGSSGSQDTTDSTDSTASDSGLVVPTFDNGADPTLSDPTFTSSSDVQGVQSSGLPIQPRIGTQVNSF